jgi:hypothetical protein
MSVEAANCELPGKLFVKWCGFIKSGSLAASFFLAQYRPSAASQDPRAAPEHYAPVRGIQKPCLIDAAGTPVLPQSRSFTTRTHREDRAR